MDLLSPITANSTVALVCTGSASLSVDEPQATADYLHQHYALNVSYREDTHQCLNAAERAAIFISHLVDANIDAIWALRGGEGSADIIPYLAEQDELISALAPKWLIGFSDFTPVIVYFAERYGWPTLHAAGALKLTTDKLDELSRQQTMDCLSARINKLSITSLQPLNQAAAAPKVINSSSIIGGCLALLNISIGDLWQPDLAGKIVIIEDVAEKSYQIRRTLKYLHRVGFFRDVAGLIFGDFTSTPIGDTEAQQQSNKTAIEKTLSQFAQTCEFPVLASNEFGHGKRNLPIMFNVPTELHLGESACLDSTV